VPFLGIRQITFLVYLADRVTSRVVLNPQLSTLEGRHFGSGTMPRMEVALFVVAAIAVVALFGLVLMTAAYGSVLAHARARRKGYHTVGAGMVVAGGCLIWVLVFVGTIIYLPPLALLTPVVAPAAMLLIVRLLPRQQVRIFGVRQGARQLIVAGWVTNAGCIPTAIAVVLLMRPVSSFREASMVAVAVLALSSTWLIAGFSLIAVGRSSERRPTLESLLTRDPRPPVLYLRPFDSERQPFVTGEYHRYHSYYRGFGGPKEGTAVFISLESYLAETIERMVGPFVALGSPEDFTHPVTGAVRKYSSDQTWQDDFDQLAAAAAIILVAVGGSANLTWEFDRILRRGWQRRLVLLTRHPTAGRSLSAKWWAWLQGRMGLSAASWSEFSAKLTALGYQLDAADPGVGTIISFDDGARAIVLSTGADLPNDYGHTFAAHVASLTAAA
jgi:hypothetical protein